MPELTVVVPAYRERENMPALLADMIGAGLKVRQQWAEGYWMDIGRPPDYAQANADFGSVFGG